MKKEFTTYNQALRLKRIGFNEPCLACFTENARGKGDELQFFCQPNDCNDDYVFIAAPTYSQAFRWFREKYNLHHTILFNNKDEYDFIYGERIGGSMLGKSQNYEEAESACLDKLLEIVESKSK